MRRTAIAIVVGALLLAAFAGAALAKVERGDDRDNIIGGTRGPDQLYGEGGNDILGGGRGGDDELHGGSGNDDLLGKTDEDRLYGGGGKDNLRGGQDADALYGGAGRDHIFHGNLRESSRDVLHGRRGNDVLVSKDNSGIEDVVYCGTGHDTVEADGADRVSGNCEEVHRR